MKGVQPEGVGLVRSSIQDYNVEFLNTNQVMCVSCFDTKGSSLPIYTMSSIKTQALYCHMSMW
jgi:hypothetical protein